MGYFFEHSDTPRPSCNPPLLAVCVCERSPAPFSWSSKAGAHSVTFGLVFARGRLLAQDVESSICTIRTHDEEPYVDTEGIRTPAGRAQWISSPSP